MAVAAAAIITAVVAVASAATSAYASYEQAQTQTKIGKFQQAVAQNQATAAQQAAEVAARQRKDTLRRVLAAQRAQIGGSGVSAAEGSPLLVQIDAAKNAELDYQRIKYGGDQTAEGFNTQGALAAFEGRARAQGAYYQAGSSLLQGVGNAAQAYGTYKYRTAQTGTG